jgi:hypothetical protein
MKKFTEIDCNETFWDLLQSWQNNGWGQFENTLFFALETKDLSTEVEEVESIIYNKFNDVEVDDCEVEQVSKVDAPDELKEYMEDDKLYFAIKVVIYKLGL